MSDDPFSESANASMQLWQQWFESMSQLSGLPGGAGGNPFAEFFANATAQSSPLSGMAGGAIPGVDALLNFGESIRRHVEEGASADQTSGVQDIVGSWVQQLLQGYEMWSGAASTGATAPGTEQLFQPLKVLFGQMPGGLEQAFHAASLPSFSEFDATAIKLPSYGPAREWQDLGKRLYQDYGRLEQARFQIDQHYQKVIFNALTQFHRGLQESDGELGSLKAIYDYWIDNAEKAYHDEVMTEAYSKAFGELINSQSALKTTQSELLNRLQETFNLPNRREIDTLTERYAALERKFDAVVERLSSDQKNDEVLSELSREIDKLREQVGRPRLASVAAQSNTAAARSGAAAKVAGVPKKAKPSGDDSPATKLVKKPKRAKSKQTARAAAKNEFGISAIVEQS